MHRTYRWLRSTSYPVLAGLLVGGLVVARGTAQEAPAAPPGPEPIAAPAASGRGSLVTIPIGGSQRLQMRKKQPIETAVNERENILSVTPVPNDPTTINLTGREAGTTRLILTGADKSVERYEVVVQLDVSYLRSILQRAAPTASLELIPAANGTVVVAGSVARSEDVDVIIRTAAGVAGGPDRVVNALRVEGVMQVQLDVAIAKVSRSELRSLSFNFFDQGANHVLTGTITPPLAPGLGQVPNANVQLGVFNNNQQFFAFLEALRTENVSKLLACPRLVTVSGRSATFVSGGDQAVPEISGGGLGGSVGGIRFEPFGVRLSFLPVVLGNGKIHLEIEPEVSLPDSNPLFASPVPQTSNGVIFGRISNRVHTSVIMEDGQTFVLGGLIQHTVDAHARKLPVLGDIPFLGVFFSAKSFNESEDEVLVVVTPHLVDPMDCGQAPKYLPGQETRSPDDFELFLEGILEAPRGRREVCPNGHYVPAWKNGPTAGAFPCGGPCAGEACGRAAGCPTAAPLNGAAAVAPPAVPAAATVGATDRLPAPESPAPAGSGKAAAAERSGSDK